LSRYTRFRKNDEGYRQWKEKQAGIYISNCTLFAFTHRSAGHRPQHDPDLLFMALPTMFHGYFPGYSDEIRESHDHLTWTVLKAHTMNWAGTVTLRCADPCVPPLVNFRYFEEGSDVDGKDLRAVVEGIRVIRRITDRLREAGCIGQEELPGEHVRSDAALADYVRDNAWGHHASCSCAIGSRETDGVLSSDCRSRHPRPAGR
jgi:choline dehydrogenase